MPAINLYSRGKNYITPGISPSESGGNDVKNIRFYVLILVLVLGTLGVGYAAWTNQLKVEGAVSTGEIDVQFMEAVWCIDQDKDVASGEVEISEDGKTLTVTIENYYPCADGVVAFWVQNKGSIPVNVNKHLSVRADFPLTVKLCTDFCDTGWEYQKLWKGAQLSASDQGDSAKAMGALCFEVPQYFCETHSTMNETFTFDVELEFIQWNKYQE